MISLEPILSKIPEKSQCSSPQAAGRKTRWLVGKKWRGLRGGNFLPARLKFGGVFLGVGNQLIYNVVIND